MNKITMALLPWILAGFSYKATAQVDEPLMGKENQKESEEIIIRKKSGKDMNVTIQINGDQILVNGKPLVEFKDDGITVNKRKIIVRDGNNNMWFGEGFPGADMPGAFSWDEGKAEKRAFLGVSTEKDSDGARISNVTEGSAAAKAGLEKDDVITKVNGKSIDGPQSLADVIGSMKPNDEVKINYKRGGKNKNLKLQLGEREDKGVRSFSFSGPDGSFKTFTIPSVPGNGEWKEMFPDGKFDLGPEFEKNMERLERNEDFKFLNSGVRRQKLGLKIQDTEDGTGVKVLDVEDSSAAAKAGMLKDDIITEIAGMKVNNTDEAREQLIENREKSTYTIKARRNGTEMTFNIKIPKKLKTANL